MKTVTCCHCEITAESTGTNPVPDGWLRVPTFEGRFVICCTVCAAAVRRSAQRIHAILKDEFICFGFLL